MVIVQTVATTPTRWTPSHSTFQSMLLVNRTNNSIRQARANEDDVFDFASTRTSHHDDEIQNTESRGTYPRSRCCISYLGTQVEHEDYSKFVR
jgi:hypothetical protein